MAGPLEFRGRGTSDRVAAPHIVCYSYYVSSSFFANKKKFLFDIFILLQQVLFVKKRTAYQLVSILFSHTAKQHKIQIK